MAEMRVKDAEKHKLRYGMLSTNLTTLHRAIGRSKSLPVGIRRSTSELLVETPMSDGWLGASLMALHLE